MSWSISLFVSSLKINETIHSIRIKQWVQQKQNITHRYGSTKRSNVVKKIWNYMITFQSLIGTVQQILYESRTNAQWQNVSISHRYGPTGEPLKSMALGGRFQSLIGTVQQNSRWREKNRTFWVSIPHRYDSTTVFTAFSVFIIPHFPCFSTFSPKIKCTLCQGHYDFFLFRFLLYICLLCRGIKVMPLIDCFHLLL